MATYKGTQVTFLFHKLKIFNLRNSKKFFNKNLILLIVTQKSVFSDSNKLTLFIVVDEVQPSTFSTHEGAGTFQALANKELTSPKANWASGL
ncbi:hypothetical protein H8356DRAFT_1335586 [Neocallimastix lanati (nom. inval.)]|nr:hypothetical protein H8356DRAFT_1335586 [Neocallimastix sp. JGI-2020a]